MIDRLREKGLVGLRVHKYRDFQGRIYRIVVESRYIPRRRRIYEFSLKITDKLVLIEVLLFVSALRCVQ